LTKIIIDELELWVASKGIKNLVLNANLWYKANRWGICICTRL